MSVTVIEPPKLETTRLNSESYPESVLVYFKKLLLYTKYNSNINSSDLITQLNEAYTLITEDFFNNIESTDIRTNTILFNLILEVISVVNNGYGSEIFSSEIFIKKITAKKYFRKRMILRTKTNPYYQDYLAISNRVEQKMRRIIEESKSRWN